MAVHIIPIYIFQRGQFIMTGRKVDEFDIRVKRILYCRAADHRTVFEGERLEWRPRKKEWTPTRDRATYVGYFYNLVENDHLHVSAELIEDKIYGPEWQIYLSERVVPGTLEEMKKFLTSIKGVGPVAAQALLDAFGLDVISTIMADATCLNSLRLPQPAKDSLYQAIVENQAFEALLVFLQGHGVSPKYATEVYKRYGSHAVEKICDNPYSLYLDDILDFPAAARLDSSMGGRCPEGLRSQAAVLACLRDDAEGNGNLYMEADELPDRLQAYFQKNLYGTSIRVPAGPDLEDALRDLVGERAIVIDSTLGEGRPIYLYKYYMAETNIAKRLLELMEAPKKLFATRAEIEKAIGTAMGSFTLTAEQRGAIRSAFLSPISILTGGPGTGKTQTLEILVRAAKLLWAGVDIRICAPTGKAAMRVQELTGTKAATIHRMLGYPHQCLKKNELVCDLLIADEYSMCDATLCRWMLDALDEGAKLLIVGDHNQLPSVGPGLVLRDLIDSETIPVNVLTKVHRQAGGSCIATNAKAIMDTPLGQVPEKLEWSTAPGGSFYFVEAKSQHRIQKMVLKSVGRMLGEGFPIDQIEVLSPIHGGLVGTDSLNQQLQAELNPVLITGGCASYPSPSGVEFRVGDKVIQTRNDYDIQVFNGETGIVKEVDYSPSKAVRIEFPGPREVWYDARQADDLDLAYSITAHRSQGSEFQAVVIPICKALLYNLDKNVLYTAITRAKQRVVFVGDREALDKALAQGGSTERNSHLALRIQIEFLAK